MKYYFLAAAIALSACTGSQGYVPTPITDRDREMQAIAFRNGLKDPSSAEVEDVQVFAAPNGNRMICGKANARNAFGGMTGFETFEVTTAGSVDYSKPYARPIFALGGVAAIDCAGAGYQ